MKRALSLTLLALALGACGSSTESEACNQAGDKARACWSSGLACSAQKNTNLQTLCTMLDTDKNDGLALADLNCAQVTPDLSKLCAITKGSVTDCSGDLKTEADKVLSSTLDPYNLCTYTVVVPKDSGVPPDQSKPATPQGSCKKVDTGGTKCTEYYDLTPSALTTAKSTCGASWSDSACPRTSSTGGCKNTAATGTQIEWFYKDTVGLGTAAEVQQLCITIGQVYVAP